MTAAAPHLRLVGEGKACSCPNLRDLLGEIHCHRCRGRLLLTHPREHLVTVAVVEAARQLMAAHLLEERGSLRDPFSPAYSGRVMDVAEAMQGLRDALLAERRYRGGAR